MATIMDFSLLSSFNKLFLFLFVFAGTYAVLTKLKVLGENKNLNAMISVVVAFFIMISKPASEFILFVVPWFFILTLVLFFFIFVAKFFGVKDSDISSSFNWNKTPIITWLIILVALIIVVALTRMFGQPLLEKNPEIENTVQQPPEVTTYNTSNHPVASTDFSTSLMATLFHPKVLSVLLLMVLGLVAIALLTKSGL